MTLSLILASAASGALSRCVVHPLDTLRARLMVRTGPQSLLGAARAVVTSHGVRGLYRGFGVSVVMQAPAMAMYLTSYERVKPALAATMPVSERNPIVHLGAGLVAETVSAVFWVPMEVVKQRAQVRSGKGSSSSSFAVVRDLLRHEGPRALFRGYAVTIGVFGPYSMLYFVSYEWFKEEWKRAVGAGQEDLPIIGIASSAAGAGAIAAALTCPLDIIKTRLQTQGDVVRSGVGGSGKRGSATVYTSTWHAVKTIAKEEGLVGFTRGLTARVFWIMPGTAITMSCFEFLKRRFVTGPALTDAKTAES